ncbi:Ubiquitin-like protein pmt3/smt3 [Tetrabaena socialis]|uniref:Ubiquitin-like protein pmt3/smt3 n=1 Tax=Tetrabaena socialis TaxID=47790 RepID=A0A2J8A6C0_9CHLO|nr:Ubiquitin-like protein pmt3/smt3 [Tetrabaena socialis]|eukprot:PNH08074.1 Ubiquitin-like protein pmt3/smt3 [Tetrabaena socialis]
MAEQSGDNEPPKIKPEGAVLNLVVKDQNGGEVHFKVKSKTRLEKVFNAYCGKKGMSPDTVRFLFDGSRLTPDQTPEALAMEDGDSIDCVIEQLQPAKLAGREVSGRRLSRGALRQAGPPHLVSRLLLQQQEAPAHTGNKGEAGVAETVRRAV